jgi:hypothetical protein
MADSITQEKHAIIDELRDVSCDYDSVARRAARVFQHSGAVTRLSWISREFEGYGEATGRERLHGVLGLTAQDPLVKRVASYRTEIGVRTDKEPPQQFAHFFVESLSELSAARERVERGASTPFVELAFGPHGAADYPRSIEFPADVFTRVLFGFAKLLRDELEKLP